MNRIFKTAILSAAIAATTLATLPAANASDWYYRHHHHGHGGAVAAGVLGLAAGALIGGALANSQPSYGYYGPGYGYYDGYARPAPVRPYYYAQPQVAYAGPYARPWTRAWYEYCADRYRSFNARSGTFTGNDGAQHFCVAN